MKPELWWITNGEVGTSSKTIWAVMMDCVDKHGPNAWYEYGVPHDPADFSRCWKLLKLIPEWRVRLPEVAEVFPVWIGFVREWDQLTKMYEDALMSDTGKAPEMYEFMEKLEDEGRIADGWIQTGPGSWHKDKVEI